MITLDTEVIEGSTFVATCVFTDETGASVVPKTNVVWKVLTSDGTELAGDSISPAATVKITVKGITLPESNRVSQVLKFVAETTYDSANGTDMPLVDYANFPCTNIP